VIIAERRGALSSFAALPPPDHPVVLGVDPRVASCVTDVLSAIEFPKPRSGSVLVEKLPLTFSMGGPQK
jgi:hypothetical protein